MLSNKNFVVFDLYILSFNACQYNCFLIHFGLPYDDIMWVFLK